MHAVAGKRFSLFLVSSKSPWFINVCPKFRNLYQSATSSSVCCTYGDLSWLKWFRLSLICPTSKAKLLACGFLKHVSTSTVYPVDVSLHSSVCLSVWPTDTRTAAGWVAFDVVVAGPLVESAAGHFAAFSIFSSHVAATISTEEALERRRRRQLQIQIQPQARLQRAT